MTESKWRAKGAPYWLDTDPADPAVDVSAVAAFAAKVGNRRVGTKAERTALSTSTTAKDQAWEGLEFLQTDGADAGEYIYRGGAWGPRCQEKVFKSGQNTPGGQQTLLKEWGAGALRAGVAEAPVAMTNGNLSLTQPGLYNVRCFVWIGAVSAATGRLDALETTDNGNVVMRGVIPVGDDVGIVDFTVAVGSATRTFQFFLIRNPNAAAATSCVLTVTRQ